MDKLLLRKKIRAIAAQLGILRPLRSLVFKFRGVEKDNREIKFLERFIGPDSHVFDVGANRGQSSENYISLGARVIAFEPQEDLHREIRQLCGNSPRLSIASCGLGSSEETRTFYITSYDQVASLREDWEGQRIGEKTIHVSTLDLQIQRYGLPSYCKIDVEGWEREVLMGLSTAIPIISFEYHQSEAETATALSVLQRIAQLGAYYCNIKQTGYHDFHLIEFVPIERFIDVFPEQLDTPLNSGYGDIFCTLDPTAVRTP